MQSSLQLVGDFTRGMIAVLPAIAGIFACNCRYFCLRLRVFLFVNCMYYCLQKQAISNANRGQICVSSACKITCEIPVLVR